MRERQRVVGLGSAVIAGVTLTVWAALINLPSLGIAVPLGVLTGVGVESLHVMPGLDLLLPAATALLLASLAFVAGRTMPLAHLLSGIVIAYILFAPLLFLPALVLGGHLPWHSSVAPGLPWFTVRYFAALALSAMLCVLTSRFMRRRRGPA